MRAQILKEIIFDLSIGLVIWAYVRLKSLA
jgi:hypothetical protein